MVGMVLQVQMLKTAVAVGEEEEAKASAQVSILPEEPGAGVVLEEPAAAVPLAAVPVAHQLHSSFGKPKRHSSQSFCSRRS